MRMARREQRPSLGGRWDRNPGLCATGFFPLYGGNRCQNFLYSHVTRTHVDDVLDFVLTTICQDRYTCDVTDVPIGKRGLPDDDGGAGEVGHLLESQVRRIYVHTRSNC